MALCKRNALKETGFTDDQIDFLMTESNRALAADYMPKADLQAQIDAAVADAQKNMPGAVTESDEYKAVAAERDMLRALGGSEFASVKPKFREAVYKMLDHAPEAESVENQLKTIAENYEEYFTPTQPAEPAKSPQFGAGVEGSMPTGKQERSFGAYWSFGRPKGEK